jgi:catechol 2,3-dioxygenase-like lactoylglutathione lyase family enzyme
MEAKMLFRDASIDKIMAFVADYDRAHNFYKQVLGLDVAWEADPNSDDQGQRNAGYRIGNNLLIIQEVPEKATSRDGWMVHFTINGADEAREYLLGKGVRCSEISEQEDFKWMWFEDPDGNKLGIVDPTVKYVSQLGNEYLRRPLTVMSFSES